MEWSNNTSWEKLLEEASKIINSEYPTRKDMVKLSKIEFNMSVVASNASNLALAEEEQYNLTRSETILEEKSRKKSITEAAEIWKYVAEKEHGTYRSMKERAKGMWNTINSVRGFKISVYSVEKENDESMFSNYKWLDD